LSLHYWVDVSVSVADSVSVDVSVSVELNVVYSSLVSVVLKCIQSVGSVGLGAASWTQVSQGGTVNSFLVGRVGGSDGRGRVVGS
jgi:hypothetical protein